MVPASEYFEGSSGKFCCDARLSRLTEAPAKVLAEAEAGSHFPHAGVVHPRSQLPQPRLTVAVRPG